MGIDAHRFHDHRVAHRARALPQGPPSGRPQPEEKLAHGFNVSIAELDEAVTWQSATIGVAAISASRDYLSGQMQQLEQAANRIVNDLGAQITDVWWQFVEEGQG